MRCPRCGFDGELVGGGCARCGYGRVSVTSGALRVATEPVVVSTPTALTLHTLMRGDTLRRGRYRLLEQIPLPENQQGQGTSWLASDAQASSRRVLVREVPLPAGSRAEKEHMVSSIASRLAELGQTPGFPAVIEIFAERDAYYIVLQQPEGESLAALIRRHGGALPERVAAEYGRQLCEMLAVLESHQPPLVHGSISPSTIIVSSDGSRVSLIHMPLFPPRESHSSKEKAPSGYLAPEQVRGIVEPASDLYALAATLHHAVTGYDPRERMAFFHPPARRLNPVVTQHMEALLSRGLRLSMAQRYARAVDMQRDLVALIQSYPPASEVPNLSVTNPLMISAEQLRQKSRKSSRVEIGVFATIGVLVLLAVLLGILPLLRPVSGSVPSTGLAGQNATATRIAQQQAAAMNTELALEMQSFQKKGVGISDGRLVFDTYGGRSDVQLKQEAAQSIQQGDLSSTINYLTKAVSADPTDGEAQIYNENLHVLQSGAPYISIILGLAIDNTAIHLVRGRSDLEAAFIAQHEINQGGLLPRGLHLRLLIDNSGVDNANVATVAQFVANRVAKVGNVDHIIAVVGWPFSSQTFNARDIIASVHVPIVSQTASSVKLSGSSPYFFRVNPPDDAQGAALGKVAVQQLHVKKVLVIRDPTDPYSVSLANAFISSVKALKVAVISNPSDYFTEGTTTVAAYHTVVNDAEVNGVDLIFMAGFDVDGVRLAHALGDASRNDPTNTFLANLKILGGDGIDTNLLLGQGNGPDATIADQFPQDMRRLIFSAFADPKEWTLLGIPQNQQPPFFSDWANTYQTPAVGANSSLIGNDAMLTNDAVQVVVRAVAFVHGPVTGQSVRDALTTIGKNGIPPYQGVSGRIMFDNLGNPIDKAVVVLTVALNGGSNQIVLIQVAGQFK